MRKPVLSILAALVALAIAAPASADHGEPIHPTLRTERVYFKCLNGEKLQNVATSGGAFPTWSTTAPTQTLQQGGGCHQYENLLSAAGANPYDLVYTGTFNGNLDTLSVELHNVYAGLSKASGTFPLHIFLSIDGNMVYDSGTTAPVAVTPVHTNPTSKLVFHFRNIQSLTEDGDGLQEREITLQVAAFNENQSFWTWDATDVPAGLTFNPLTMSGKILEVPDQEF